MADSDDETPPSATFVHCTPIYVRNLDEKIKIPHLTNTLREVFGTFGEILDIVAKKSIKRKGQAFIVYDSADSAEDAMDTLQGFELLGKPMTLAYAKTRSDVIVQREDGDEALEAHKKLRLGAKEHKQAIEAEEAAKNKRAADSSLAERPAKVAKPAVGVVPEELLPPNKILLLRDVPENYGKDMLTTIFSRFPGFKEVRTVATRAGIAFVEYEDEEGATMAKERVRTLGDREIKVTYQRKTVE